MVDDYKLTHQSISSTSSMKNDNPLKPKGASNGTYPLSTSKNDHQSRDQEQSGCKGEILLNSGPTCAYCKRKEHLLSECWTSKKKEKKRFNTLVTTTDLSSGKVLPKTPDTFKPFVSQGYISINRNSTEGVPILILCDAGASQSLLAEGVLPLSELSATGESVLIHGVELGFTCVPLHSVLLKSNLVSGPDRLKSNLI